MNHRIRRILTIVSAVVIAALVSPVTAAEAADDSGSTLRAPKTRVNVNSGKCLTIAAGSTANLATAVQFTCDGHPSRFWNFIPRDGGTWLQNDNSNLCLTINSGSMADLARAIQAPCDNNQARLWTFIQTPGTGGLIKNVHTGKCLTLSGGSTANNATVVQFRCDNDEARRWV